MDTARQSKALDWTALALLVVSVCINYADRTNLAVAAKSIERDLQFRQDFLGVLLGGFFWTYSLLQLAAGKLIDRWNVNWVYAGAFLLWSGATALTGLANSFAAILCLRLLLGAGESVAYPAYSKIIACTFPERLRGTANALIDAGSKMGPALGVLAGVKMLGWLSWRGMFVAIGCCSFLWLIPWSFVSARLGSRQFAKPSLQLPTYRELLSKRAFLGTALGLFGGNYTWYFLLTWLPYYFENERHYTRDRLALIASLPFWAVAVSSIFFGWLADALIRRGKEAGSVRQAFVTAGLIACCAFLLPALLIRENFLSNVFLILACVSLAMFSSNNWALTQRLSGPEAAGKWTSLQNCLGNFAGIIAPYVTGLALHKTHSFFVAFAIACAILLLGAGGYSLVIGKADPLLWSARTTEAAESPKNIA
jgi:MFS transporter, ACS family, D-galactonate transporter